MLHGAEPAKSALPGGRPARRWSASAQPNAGRIAWPALARRSDDSSGGTWPGSWLTRVLAVILILGSSCSSSRGPMEKPPLEVGGGPVGRVPDLATDRGRPQPRARSVSPAIPADGRSRLAAPAGGDAWRQSTGPGGWSSIRSAWSPTCPSFFEAIAAWDERSLLPDPDRRAGLDLAVPPGIPPSAGGPLHPARDDGRTAPAAVAKPRVRRRTRLAHWQAAHRGRRGAWSEPIPPDGLVPARRLAAARARTDSAGRWCLPRPKPDAGRCRCAGRRPIPAVGPPGAHHVDHWTIRKPRRAKRLGDMLTLARGVRFARHARGASRLGDSPLGSARRRLRFPDDRRRWPYRYRK